MTLRVALLVAAVFTVALAACDSDSSEVQCLTVTPTGGYTLSGEAGTTSFAPASMRYTVRNTCDDAVDISIEEDVRWIDVDIVGSSAESGTLAADGEIEVDIGVVYGTDNPERLDQLAAGTYSAEVQFVDETNDNTITRPVNVTVN